MRDLLTVLAGIVILALVAAMAVPPFVDWRSQRAYVDAALSRATGLAVRTDGAIDLRLLPTPRLAVEGLRVGDGAAEDASLHARHVDAEVALTPLLSGEVRFLQSRVERLELKLPAGAGGDWRIPRALLSEDTLRRTWVFEDLAVGQLLLTTVDPQTGRTDQGYAEQVRLQSQSLAGPWRAEGLAGGVRFSLVTGEIALSGPTNVKLSTEGEGLPRLALDARMFLDRGPGDVHLPRLEGTARLVGAREAVPVPYTVSTGFKTAGRLATLDSVSVEAGEGASTLRLGGTGEIALDAGRLTLALEGRRLDWDGLAAAYREASEELRRRWRPQPDMPLDLSLRLDGLALGGEELTGISARTTLAGDRIGIDRLDFTAPGQTRVSASGEVSLAMGGGGHGRVTLSARSADRLAAYLGRFGIPDFSGDALAGRALEASADITAANPVASLRNLQVRLGDATLTGALRYTAAEAASRARIDAQVAIQGLDLDALPQLTGLFDAGRAIDLGLILDARNVGYGVGERGGRVAARFASEGQSLTIDLLEITDLAGANASLRGRITADGSGRIGGRLRARRAAPLIDLVGRAALGGLAELVPPFLREAPLDAAVLASRAPAAAGTEPALVTKVSGSAGGGGLEAEITSAEGRVAEISATLTAEQAGAWFGTPALARPARLELKGGRDASGRLAMRLAGDVAGLRIATVEPFGLSPRDTAVESGEAQLSSADIAPLLPAIGQRAAGPVDADVKLRVGRREGAARVELTGHVGESVVDADLSGPSLREVSGRVLLGQVSLPWIASVLALGSLPEAPAGSPWAAARFPNAPNLPVGGTVAVRAVTADLGRGLAAQRAEFTLATTPDGFAIRDFGGAFLGGRLSGTLSVNRQGGLASLIGEGTVTGASLPDLVGRPVRQGRISGNLRFGGSGESLAGIVASLGGAGAAEFEELELAGADPEAIGRTVQRALRGDDTLVPARLQAIAAEELDRAPLRVVKAMGQATFVSGGLRISPLVADAGAATWQGSAALDLRTLSLDIRGTLTAKAPPRNWSGSAPYLTLGWAGPLGRAARTLDVGPLSNGLASVVLTRELDRIETFELDAAERMRINSRVEMDRARRAAAEEAARLARQREEAERARRDAEQIMGGARPADGPGGPLLAPPVDIRPPAQGGAASGG
ncbi:AsmA-like C-terminal region-containing protein [Enterovirga aerilata]|uniref:AsmA family protein n=1 Tax=Enterovirga aerilata TaxID=2730920 RepID=A0A849I1M9_9HYPH|nr:AsmA-like C-terminal region-containing protein [Enterovirga sp. DB1703]NNM71504.1 AsmA family protein [Enterovirga sp. DB1703]